MDYDETSVGSKHSNMRSSMSYATSQGAASRNEEHLWNGIKRAKKLPEAFMFDLDGLLIDSMGFHYESWRRAFRKVGVDVSEHEVYEREGESNDVLVYDLFMNHLKARPSNAMVRSIVKSKEEAYERMFRLQLYPGAAELLTFLQSRRVKLALVTGSTSVTATLKQRSEMLNSFDVIVTGADTRHGKPEPDPYLMAFSALSVQRESCYVVENAPLGIRSAVAADLICLAVIGNSVLSEDILRTAGAHIVYDTIEHLRRDLVGIYTSVF